jgi:hypothetical protein
MDKTLNVTLAEIAGGSRKRKQYKGVIVPDGHSKHTEDLIKDLIRLHPEYDPATIRTIITQAGDKIVEYLTKGCVYQSDYFRLSPAVRGKWDSLNPSQDKGGHVLSVNLALMLRFRKMIKGITFHVIGEKLKSFQIDSVECLAPNTPANVIIPNEILRITGKRIRVDPVDEDGIGVSLLPMFGSNPAPQYQKLLSNQAGKIDVQISRSLPPGGYILQLRSRYTTNTTRYLDEVRILEYNHPLTIPPASPERD